ncbi:MAG: SUMF1/EgtB/PvdO family nonheme iron enzyme [Candidatus Marinimicrobia bacterium]|nr:SUMF1/EgtB/PvdO family nonheme iron enzyme [Candidatus Neomarinimicrobiota bacterium]
MVLLSAPIFAQCDWNGDMSIDVLDVVSIADCIVNQCWDGSQCDWNGDGSINIIDIVVLIECILDECVVFGCMTSYANNFNPEAMIDDGSCEYFEWVTVPAGEFTYGWENCNGEEWCGETFGEEVRSIDYDFEIMKYEVTNTQYIAFLQETWDSGILSIGGCSNYYQGESCIHGYYEGDEYFSAGDYVYYLLDPDYWDPDIVKIQFDGEEFTILDSFSDHPVSFVTWFGAVAFSERYNKRLPTDEEWEKTARGLTGYEYPCGESYGDDMSDKANYMYSGDPWGNATTPVGYYNGNNETIDCQSPYGTYDLAGNVGEWTITLIPSQGYLSEWENSTRGGGWSDNSYIIQSWFHYNWPPMYGFKQVGFRLTRDLAQE